MRRVLAFVGVLVLSAVAAAFLGGDVSQLDSDITARLAAIGDPPATRALKREAKGLKDAQVKLTKYTGRDSVADFKVLASAGKLLIQSGTADQAIRDDVVRIIQDFGDGVQRREDIVANYRASLIDPGHVRALDAALKQADRFFDQANALIANSPLKAAPLFVQAYDLAGRVVAQGQRLVDLEQGSPPPDGLTPLPTATSLGLANTSAVNYDLGKIRVFANVYDGATIVKTYVGETAKSQIAGLFAAKGSNRIAPATTFDLTAPVLAPLVPMGTQTPRIQGQLWITVKNEPFFVVYFDVALP